jgi:hypothetical protein
MTNETKERLMMVTKILFFPITGFYFLITECKNDSYENFYAEWFLYVLKLIIWCGCVAFIAISIWGLIYHFSDTIIPISIFGGGIFVFFILPVIIHKRINRK